MADFEPPSFSLGFDLDLCSELQSTPRTNASTSQAKPSSTSATLNTINEEEDDDFESPSAVPDPKVADPRRTFKRLRRGPTSEPVPASRKLELELASNLDDDIEEFSSQEDPPGSKDDSSRLHSSICSSSKTPFARNNLLISKPGTGWGSTKKIEVSNAPSSSSMENTMDKCAFPRLTVSPLRRFQLIDSDSDDAPAGEGVQDEPGFESTPVKEDQHCFAHSSFLGEQATVKSSRNTPQTQDLWKDFCLEKSYHVPTPAFDEVCKEYFRSAHHKNGTGSTKEGYKQNISFIEDDIEPQNCDLSIPSHRYFFHKDPMIRKLVQGRLPNFFPLGAKNGRGHMDASASVIDYMSQFNHGEGPKRVANKGSTGRRRSAKKVAAENLSPGSESWVNPRSSAQTPKDAGKRRVHAVSKSAGHWYTDANGKRVYVTRNGQELTGQIAYRHYKKESGGGFKKSGMASASKKKSAAKRK